MSDAERIAARLSPAQRKALLWLPADGSVRERVLRTGAPTLDQILSMIYHKRHRGPLIGTGRGHKHYCLTPLGREVRAVLAREARDE